jgi:hypothetical protein
MSTSKNRLLSIWQRQATATMDLTPQQLRQRAEKFQAHIRRRNIRDYVCASIPVVGFALCIFTAKSPLTQLGSAMMMLWGLYFIYGLNRFGSASPLPVGTDAQSCFLFHRQQLIRQRDLALSRPWGIALAIPGMVLFVLGMQLNGRHPDDWAMTIGLIGVFIFTCIAVVIDGQLIADSLQKEINALEEMA